MPKTALGQQITFSIENDADQDYRRYIWVDTRVGDTIRKIVARRGHPEDARAVAKLNSVRSTTKVLRHKPRKKGDKTRIRVPGELRAGDRFHVLAGDQPPQVVGGYAKFETVDRPGRTGLTMFSGYDPITMRVPIRFEAFQDRDQSGELERDIALLERMAGRGDFPGAAVGPPPVIRLATTNNKGEIVPLIPLNYQWSSENAKAPVWRIVGLDWDDEPLRRGNGRRIRQEATVTVQQHTRATAVTRSASARARNRKKKTGLTGVAVKLGEGL